MNEILKKINDRAEYIAKKTGDEECDSNNELIAMGLQIAIEIIQAEQKEVKQRKIKFHQKQLKELLKDKPKTKGDVIRESNFRLANTMYQVTDCKKCLVKDGCEVTNQFACYSRWCDYLNRPVEE